MTSNGSVYYKDAGRIPLASRISYTARRRVFEKFMDVMSPVSQATVLDVGVTSDMTHRESNFFEQFYPHREKIVCVGTENGEHLEQIYPGIRFIPVNPGRPLPFADNQFDIVFSNAVVEHVGGYDDQRAFISEICRVGRRAFVVTPNRWFPIEVHTAVPLLHFLPKSMYRRLISRTSLAYWADERHLNLLSKPELSALFPRGYAVSVELAGVGWGWFRSNVVAYVC